MTEQVWRSVEEMARYAGPDDDVSYDDVPSALEAGERIGGPVARAKSKALRRGLALTMTAGAAWALFAYPEVALSWLPEVSSPVTPPADARLADTKPAAPVASVPEPVVAPLASVEVAATPGADPKADAVAPADGDSTGAGGGAGTEAARGPMDATVKRATAVGLHPDISRALLDKLSAADFKNAAAAIKTALAETPDTGIYVFPREAKGDTAVFQVRFVPGADAGCRRYVVEIAKDRWLTTALPVEKCGAGVKAVAAQAASR